MFWDKFYNLCSQNGISPNKAAQAMNISSGSVTEWKKGRTPQMKTVKKIADYFGVSTEALLGKGDIISSEGTSNNPTIYNLISPLNEKETMVILAYRSQKDMQPAIDRLLGLSENGNVLLYEAAKSDNNSKHKITIMPLDKWEAIENTPDTEEDLL